MPKPLRKIAGCRRVGAGGSESRAGLALQGLRGFADSLWAKPPAGPSHPLPSPLSCLSTILSSPGILSQETLPRGGKQSQAGQGKGLWPGGAQVSARPSSRHSQPWERTALTDSLPPAPYHLPLSQLAKMKGAEPDSPVLPGPPVRS